MNRLVLFLTAAVVAPVVFAFNGVMWIPDVRVAPLLQTHWGQTTDTGSNRGQPCFNLYTPQNMSCGCSATAMAQILRYWQYPASAPAGKYVCSVSGVTTELSISAGAYDWAKMPLDTRDGVSPEECEAIGKLTYDCALVMHTMFVSGSSLAFSDSSFSALTGSFGYANAIGYCPKGGLPFDGIRNAIFASLDIGSPVMASLVADDDAGHQVLIDGYGFDGATPYVHILFGWPAWSDMCDCWYVLPRVNPTEDKDFTRVDGIVYNIFPNDTGDVLSGRVLDEAGKPVAGATVMAVKKSAKSGDAVVTDENGVYAFLLQGGATYTITCGKASRTVNLAKSVSADCSWTNPLQPSFTNGGTCGNSWGNDLVLKESGEEPVPPPVPPEEDELGPFMPAKAVKNAYPYCGAMYDSEGALCGTLTLSVGKPSRKGVSTVSGAITLLDGKKYTIKSTKLDVDEVRSAEMADIKVNKLGLLDLRIGNKGFAAELTKEDGTVLTASTSDLSMGLPEGNATFSIEGFPEAIEGAPVLAGTSADGQRVTVKAKGKLDCGKAASIKYKKVTVKDPLTKKKSYSYELQGLDDPKKPNVSGLKLTYTAKTALLKGSFYIYTDVGTAEKPKLKKTTAKVTGFVVEGEGAGLAVAKFGKTTYSWHVTLR